MKTRGKSQKFVPGVLREEVRASPVERRHTRPGHIRIHEENEEEG